MKRLSLLLAGLLAIVFHSGAQGLFWGTSAAPSSGGGGPTFDQLASSNAIAVYDLSKMGFTLNSPSANINLTDWVNGHNLALQNTGPYSTNWNGSGPELNGTNFWTYDNGVGLSSRWKLGSTLTQSQPISVYCLMRVTSSSAWNFFDFSGESFRWHNSNGQWDLNAGTAISGGTITFNQWRWYEIQFNGSSSFAKVSDSTVLVSGNAGANGMGSIEVGDDTGNNFFYQGDIAFISIHAGAMSSGFATQFHTAAAARFGSSVP